MKYDQYFINIEILQQVFFFLALPHDLQDICSPSGGWTRGLSVKIQNPNH